MSSNAQEQPAAGLCEIKASFVNLLSIRPSSGDTERIAAQLANKVRKAPEFFRNAPIVIDLSGLDDPNAAIDFGKLLPLLKTLGLSPVGVRGGSENLHSAATSAGLVVLGEVRSDAGTKAGAKSTPAPSAISGSTKLIDFPVRSGQRIYAPGGDLIVLAPVSPGAEIMADGHIHVYSSLRGRALAGVQGNVESRIFCLDLQAELIAIGGHYQISENLEESIRGKPVQVFLRHDVLIIEDL